MMPQKAVIFDSGPLINLAMNGLLYTLEELKKNFNGKFLITSQVRYEVFDRPIGIHKFELGALEIESLIQKGILELPDSVGITEEAIKTHTREIMDLANHFYHYNGQWIEIVSDAEMSCLALCSELSKNGVDSIIAIDERTARMLCEDPQTLQRIISEKNHKKMSMIAPNMNIFSHYKFIRSSEIVFTAYKKGLIRLSGPKVLEAALYATKFKGAAISDEEISSLKKY
jgi:hypothetical protein